MGYKNYFSQDVTKSHDTIKTSLKARIYVQNNMTEKTFLPKSMLGRKQMQIQFEILYHT